MTLTSIQCSLISQIQELQQQDSGCGQITKSLQEDKAEDSKYS